MLKYRFDLSAKKNCSIKSFVIRETNGRDEEQAAIFAKAKGAASSSFEELVRLSVVSVNDAPVEQPFTAFDDWNSRTRMYVLQAYRSINAIESDKEVDDFLASATQQD